MNETLIEALNAYTTALEQKISALELRVAQLEGLLAANATCDQHTAILLEQLQSQVAEQEERIARLETAPTPQPATEEENEPEIEVELITEDDEEPDVEVVAEQEPTAEEQPTEQTASVEGKQPIETTTEPEQPKEVTANTEEETTTEQPTESATKEQPKIEEQPKANGIYGKTVQDIRMAISIGDRFLFQRELFDKNPELLQKTLTDLNGLNSFDEAMAYIDSHFGWAKEQPAYELFINVLHRRFGM